MRTIVSAVGATAIAFGVAAGLRADSAGSSAAQSGNPSTPATGVIQSQDANTPGLVAELTECRRRDGVLSLKVRLRNTSSAAVFIKLIDNRNFDDYYVTAAAKKYFVLRDDEKVPLASAISEYGKLAVEIPKGGTWTWWAKYPAPPDSETKITYHTPLAAPFEDVPISK